MDGAKESVPHEINISLRCLGRDFERPCKGGGIGILFRPDLIVKPNKSFVNIFCAHIINRKISRSSVLAFKCKLRLVNKKKPIPFGNRFHLNPKIYVESPTPRRVGYTLPKIRENNNSITYLTPLLNQLNRYQYH
jgi:hypothetical protein